MTHAAFSSPGTRRGSAGLITLVAHKLMPRHAADALAEGVVPGRALRVFVRYPDRTFLSIVKMRLTC